MPVYYYPFYFSIATLSEPNLHPIDLNAYTIEKRNCTLGLRDEENSLVDILRLQIR